MTTYRQICWETVKSEDVNLYASNFTDQLINLSKDCIPHKHIRVRPKDLPWINSSIRKLMRKRNLLYKKYKLNKTEERYAAFKKLRNDVTAHLRKSKKEYFESLACKLKSSSLSSSDYWKTLKSFKKSSTDTSIPLIFHNGAYVSDNDHTAKLLNEFFVSQTIIKVEWQIPPPVFSSGICRNIPAWKICPKWQIWKI